MKWSASVTEPVFARRSLTSEKSARDRVNIRFQHCDLTIRRRDRMISQTSSAAMQNFKGSCFNLIAFVVQTQLSGEERHCNAEVNFVRLLDDHPFHFGHQSDNDSSLLLQSLAASRPRTPPNQRWRG